MGWVPDSERGLDPQRFDLARLGWDAFRPAPDVPGTAAERQEEAATTLGKIYLELPEAYRRLGDWAVPTQVNARTSQDERILAFQLDVPTAKVLGANLTLAQRIRAYDRHFDNVMPEVAKRGLEWGKALLAQQQQTLRTLWIEIGDATFGEWMQGAAREVQRDARDLARAREGLTRRKQGKSDPVARAREFMALYRECLVAAAKAFVRTARTTEAPAAYLKPQMSFQRKSRFLQLLQVLLVHPRNVDVVSEYAISGARGTALARGLIRESAEALTSFSRVLANQPGSVWRYPPLIIGGVRQIGFDAVEGFRGYTLAVAAVIGRSTPDSVISYIGMGLGVIGLMSTGLGVGAVVLDLALNGASFYFNFVRDREQELAVKASLFLPDENRFATEYDYGGSAMAAAFLLLSALSLFRAVKSAKGPRVESSKTAPSAPAPSKPATTTTSTTPSPATALDELRLAADEAPLNATPTAEQVAKAINTLRAELEALEKEGLKAAAFREFYLTPRQAQTFSRLTDATLKSAARPLPVMAAAERATLLAEAEKNAENLRKRLARHWDEALPRRGKQTAEQAALDVLTKLQKAPSMTGTTNANVRDRFFDLWRERFLKRVAKDPDLILDLEVQAGVVFARGTGANAFRVLVRDEAGKLAFVGLDLDHAVIRHEDAVMRALRTNDASLLVSTVDSANLQLMTGRENQYVIEALRALDDQYWSVEPGPLVQAIQPFR